MIIKSLKVKNIVLFMIILTVLFIVVGVFFYHNLYKKLYADIDAVLYTTGVSVADSIDTLFEKEKEKTIKETINEFFFKIIKSWIAKSTVEDPKLINIIVQIYDKTANLIVSSRSIQSINTLSQTAKSNIFKNENYFEEIFIETMPEKWIPVRFLALPIVKDNSLVYIVRVGIPLRTMTLALNNFRFFLLIVTPLLIVLVGFLALYLTYATLLPVRNMIKTVKQITNGNLKLRIDIPESKDEIKNLADNLNIMVEKLDTLFSSQQQLIEDLSHEIKTPLSVIKGKNEVYSRKERSPVEYNELLKSNIHEINRVIKLVENLLIISSFNSKTVELHLKRIEINNLINELLNDMEVIFEEKNIVVEKNIEDNLFIEGDESLLKGLFINLIDNALKSISEKGRLIITVKRIDNEVKIEIEDNGKGIPEDQLPYIFDRYYRAIKSKDYKGFGIGLNIVKSTVEMHNGRVEVKSRIGHGTTFILCFMISNS